MKRLPDWPSRLADYIRDNRSKPFCWGSHDCATFAAGAVEAQTGESVLSVIWSDASSAADVLRDMGGLEAAVGFVLPSLKVSFAKRGDIALIQSDRPFLAVVTGPAWIAPGVRGCVTGPMSAAVKAWGVGGA